MGLKIVVLIVVLIVLVGFALSIPEISPLYKTVNVIDTSLGYNVATSTTGISQENSQSTAMFVSDTQPIQTYTVTNTTVQITVEQYKAKHIMLTDTVKYEVKNSNRNCFKQKLLQLLENWNITLVLYHKLEIYVNETGQLLFSRTFNFTEGYDRSITVYVDDGVYHLENGTVLRIELYNYIKLVIPFWNLTYERTTEKTVYTVVYEKAREDMPYVKFKGVLTETEKGVAVKVNSFSWRRTWAVVDYVLVYLTKNGTTVQTVSELGFNIGDLVEVSGLLYRDLYGTWYLELSEIELFEGAIIQ